MFTSSLEDSKSKIISQNHQINKNSISNRSNKNDSFSNISKINNNSSFTINKNINELLHNENDKQKKLFHIQSKQHPKCSSCTSKYEKILDQNKSALSNYIINNSMSKKNYYAFPNIKLLGNSRYKYSSPLLFVEDQKIDGFCKNIGLVPIPFEKFKKVENNNENTEEDKDLYELQRSIVMLRRLQYNDYKFKKGKNKIDGKLNNNNQNDDIYNYINKVIFIQRCWRSVTQKNYFKNKIDLLETQLNNFEIHQAFNALRNVIIIKKNLNSVCFISKDVYINSNEEVIEQIKKIQNNYRIYKNLNKYKNLFIKKNMNTGSYITKDRYKYSSKFINQAIKLIQKNYKIYKINKTNPINNNDTIKNNNNISIDNNSNNSNNSYNNICIKDFESEEPENNNNDNNDENKNKEKNQSNDENINLSSYKKNENDNDIDDEKNNNIMEEYISNSSNSKEKNSFIQDNNSNNNNNIIINDSINNNKNLNNEENSQSSLNKNNKINNTENNNNKNIKKIRGIINDNFLDSIIVKTKTVINRSPFNKNHKKITQLLKAVNKCLLSLPFKKIKSYNKNPIVNIPNIKLCYITKERKNKVYNKNKNDRNSSKFNSKMNTIEKMEIHINYKDDYIDKIYKKPIINGKSFKYQYYFSNNPYSYVNVCYISKKRENNQMEYLLKIQRKVKSFLIKNKIKNNIKNNNNNKTLKNDDINNNNNSNKNQYIKGTSKDILSKKPSEEIKTSEVNDINDSLKKNNLPNSINLEKNVKNPKRNNKLPLTHLSDNKNTKSNSNKNNIEHNDNNKNNNNNYNNYNNNINNYNNNNKNNNYNNKNNNNYNNINNNNNYNNINNNNYNNNYNNYNNYNNKYNNNNKNYNNYSYHIVNNNNDNNKVSKKIIKNVKNGFFISKKIFKNPKKEIIKIQHDLRKMTLSKNKVFKRPSNTYIEHKNLTNRFNENNDSNIFDTENVKAMIIVNKNKKKPINDEGLYFSHSSNNENEENIIKTNNNYLNSGYNLSQNKIINTDNLEIFSNNKENNRNNNIINDINYNNQKDYENNESESDSAIITKIRLNYNTQEDNKNNEDNNSYLIIHTNSSKDIYYISKERKINFNKYITTIQNKYKNHLILKHSKKKNININVYQKPKSKSCIISRSIKNITDKYLFMYNPQIKYFIFLINLFITKNIQEYLFKIIKNKKFEKNNKDLFGFPFYIRTIQRVKNYLHKKNNPNKKISLFFYEIFDYKNKRFKNILNKLCFLSKKEKKQLINSNIYTGYEENELIHFLSDFSKFDKNINNEKFIIERLRQTKLNNTNIFTLVKLIDIEYDNLVKGLYCLKCYNYINICKCFSNKNIIKKEKQLEIDDNESNMDMEEDLEMIDNELNDNEDLHTKRKINCFDYNTNDNNQGNILIKTKSKVNKNNNNQKIVDYIFSSSNP